MPANFDTQDPELSFKMTRRRALSFLWGLLRKYPFGLATVILIGIGVALSEWMSIALLLPFLESLRGDGATGLAEHKVIGFLLPYFEGLTVVSKIRIIAVALLVFEIIKQGLRFLNGRLSYLLQIKVDREIRMSTFDHLLKVGLGFIHKEKIANLFTILNNYTGHTSQMALMLVTVVPDLFTMAVSLYILISLSVQLSVIALVFSFITSLLMGGFMEKARILGRAFNQCAVRCNHIGFEMLSGMSLIRLFAREKTVRKKYREAINELHQATYRKGLLESFVTPFSTTLYVLVLMVLLIAATFILAKKSEFWVELLFIFLVISSRINAPMGRINTLRAQLAGFLPSISSLQEFLRDDNKPILPEGTLTFDHLKEGIRFENVSFDYATDEAEVISELSFNIPKGKTTAIVGASGSGKSTLVALLARLFDPTSGRIVVDGCDLREFQSRTWRRRIGVVSQSSFFFNDTIRNNITFGRPDATDQEVKEAALKANAHEFISEMQEGYETSLGDRGVRLSGGQAQRVAIARAVLVDPELLILDEATSSLDTVAERMVQEAIERVCQNRTVVVVAHRLSTIRDADNIIVLEKGRIVEQGNHEELIAKRGIYWNYVKLQSLGEKKSVDDPAGCQEQLGDETLTLNEDEK